MSDGMICRSAIILTLRKENDIMKKIIAFLKKLWNYDPWKPYIDAGVIDFSGQGRNKYGR